jgi:hypothetical protein
MFSSQFLTSYCVFSAAVSAYRGMPEETRNALEDKTVADAFSKATTGMSKKDQTALLQFVLKLIQQPEQFSQNAFQISNIEFALDRAIGNQYPEIANEKRILIEAEFLARAGITKVGLSQKLRERRIFSIPEWVHKDKGEEYYPAFFVEPHYDPTLLEAVSITLRTSSGARKYRFFTTPDPTLEGNTPLAVLATGELERVVNAAKAFRKRTVTKLDNV